MRIEWTPSLRDYVALHRVAGRSLRRRALVVGVFLSIAVVTVARLFAVHSTHMTLPVFLGALLLVLWTARVLLLPWTQVRRTRRRRPGLLPLTTQTLVVGPNGLRQEGGGASAQIAWPLVGEVHHTRRHLVFLTPPVGGLVVPLSAVPGPARLLAQVAAWRDAPPEPRELPPDGPDDEVLRYALAAEDYLGLARTSVEHRLRRGPRLLAIASLWVLLAVYGGLLVLMGESRHLFIPGGLALALLTLFVSTIGWWWRVLLPSWVRRLMRKHPERFTVAEQVVTVRPDGLARRSAAATALVPWFQITRVDRDPDRAYLFLGDAAYIVPRRAFPDDVAFHRFADQVEARAAAARAPEPSREVAAPDADDPFAPPAR